MAPRILDYVEVGIQLYTPAGLPANNLIFTSKYIFQALLSSWRTSCLKLTYQLLAWYAPDICLPTSPSLCSPRHVPLLYSQSLLACCAVRVGILEDVNNIYMDALTSFMLIYVIDMCVSVSVCLMLRS